MPSWVLITLGLLIVIITMIDIIWSTLSTNGAGPIARSITTGIWLFFRTIYRRRRSHGILKVNVVVILVATFVTWLILVWSGWTVVFIASEGAVFKVATGEPALLADRIYFVGMTIFTLGTGDFVAGSTSWRLLMVIASANGLVMITMVITYLLPIVEASIDRRKLALSIWGLGDSAAAILENGWNGRDFRDLNGQLQQVATLLFMHSERHLAYPVLQYFHASNPRADLSPRLATLDDAVTLLETGIEEDFRPPANLLRSLRQALSNYLHRVELHRPEPTEDVPDFPDFDRLRTAGIPLLDDLTLLHAFEERLDHRQMLLGLLRADCWEWGD